MGLGIRKRFDDELGIPLPLSVQDDAERSAQLPVATISDSGITPRDVTWRSQESFPSYSQPEPIHKSPGIGPPLSFGSRNEASPNQAPFSSFDGSALASVVSKRPTQPLSPREEYDELAAQRPVDKNGRLKSALLNALTQMSHGANRVLSSGRPVDEYGLAGIVGGGIGGATRGGFDPAIDERTKRQFRMDDLANTIQQQVKMERQQAELDNLTAETQKHRAWEGIQSREAESTAFNRKRAAVHQNLEMLKGQQLNPASPAHAKLLKDAADLGEHVDVVEWNKSIVREKNFTGFLHDQASGISTYYKGGEKTDFTAPSTSLIDPSQRFAAETAANKEGRTIERSNAESQQQNAQIQTNIAEATTERNRIADVLKTTPPMVTRTRRNDNGDDETYETPNPVHADYMQRYRQLDDQIRRDRAALKPVVSSSGISARRSPKPGAIKASEDPSVRAYANRFFGGDYAAAVKAIAEQKRQ